MPPPIGYGCDFQYGGATGGSYATVGPIVDIEPPDQKFKKIDQSYLQMPIAARLYGPGIADCGEATLTMLWNPAAFTLLQSYRRLGYQFWRIQYNDPVTSTPSFDYFQGHISEIAGKTIEIEGVLARQFKVQVTGTQTFTQAT